MNLYDHVYAHWKSSGEWFYGYIAAVSGCGSETVYTILFEDGDVLGDVVRVNIQFLDRPQIEDLPKQIRSMIQTINSGVNHSTTQAVDLKVDDKDIKDPERCEIFGQNDLC